MLLVEDVDAINRCQGRVVIGYSGGVDSHVLMHYVCQVFKRPINAIHVNHGIHPGSDEWARHCAGVCADLNVTLTCSRVTVERSGNLEANARSSRYEAFKNYLEPGDLLLLAHHQDDQIETVLLHLLRGDSLFGLKGMPHHRRIGHSFLRRPFLHLSRQIIEEYAKAQGLVWREDDSNSDRSFDRNYLRHEILPRLKVRWPRSPASLVGAMTKTSDGVALIEKLAESDLGSQLVDQHKILLDDLSRMSKMRQRNLLRAWLRSAGVKHLPGDRVLTKGLENLIHAGVGTSPIFSWQGVNFRRFADHIYLTPHFEAESAEREYSFRVGAGLVTINNGVVRATSVRGDGLTVDLADITIRFRRGGEKIKFDKTRSLKNILQEHGIPSFLRDYIPLLYRADELVGVCGVPMWKLPFIVAPSSRTENSDTGWEIDWVFELHDSAL